MQTSVVSRKKPGSAYHLMKCCLYLRLRYSSPLLLEHRPPRGPSMHFYRSFGVHVWGSFSGSLRMIDVTKETKHDFHGIRVLTYTSSEFIRFSVSIIRQRNLNIRVLEHNDHLDIGLAHTDDVVLLQLLRRARQEKNSVFSKNKFHYKSRFQGRHLFTVNST